MFAATDLDSGFREHSAVGRCSFVRSSTSEDEGHPNRGDQFTPRARRRERSAWIGDGAYVVASWLGAIILNLLISGRYFDIALRDFGLVLGALALGPLAGATTAPKRA